jgi:large repetitive protein
MLMIPFQVQGENLQTPEAHLLSLNSSDFRAIYSGATIDTFIDSVGSKQELSFKSMMSSPSTKEVTFWFQLKTESADIKDRYLIAETFQYQNGNLQALNSFEFDTNSKKESHIQPKFDFAKLKGIEHLYFRVGVKKDKSSSYSDETLFKIWIPAKMLESNEPTPAEKTDGNYVLIHNESVDGASIQSTRGFSLNKENPSKLPSDSFRMDTIKPFNLKENKHKLLRASYKAASSKLGSERSFWVTNEQTGSDYQIQAKLLYVGSKAQVWVHNNEITADAAAEIGKEFDDRIHPTISTYFGKESDVDKDGKINLLLFDIVDGYSGSGAFMSGYFNQADLYQTEKSNKSEIVYIDTYPSLGAQKNDFSSVYSTITHELQHLVNYNQNVIIEGNTKGMDVWLDEALSMAAEQIYQGAPLAERIEYYNESTSIANGHSLLYWDYDGDTLSNYALSYLFGQYVKIQAEQGDKIFKEILTHPDNNYKAVERVVQRYISPSLTFPKFMTHFREALFLKEATGLKGFRGDSTFAKLQTKIYTGGSTRLRGGGAIFAKVNTEEGYIVPSITGSSITHILLSLNGIPTDQIPILRLMIDPVGENDELVTGKGFVNGKINIKVDQTLIGSGTAGADGKFAVAIPKQKRGTRLTIEARNANNSYSTFSNVTVIDTTAPDKPVLFPINDRETSLKGTSESRDGMAYVMKNGQVLSWSNVNSSGKFSLFVNLQPAGTVLTVYIVDFSGNKGNEVSIVVGKTAPDKPLVLKINNEDTVVIGRSEPGSSVFIKKGQTVIGKGKANSNSDFAIKIPRQKVGTSLTLYAEDRLGQRSKELLLKVATAPAKPLVGLVGDHQAVVSGKASAGLTVVVMSGNKKLGEGVTNSKGIFSVMLSAKPKAGSVLNVYTMDSLDSKSSSVTVKVQDKTAPSAPTVSGITSKSTSISGKAEKGSTVYVYSGKKLVGKTSVSTSGTYKTKIAAQKKGTKLTVYAVDRAGNKSKVSVGVVK